MYITFYKFFISFTTFEVNVFYMTNFEQLLYQHSPEPFPIINQANSVGDYTTIDLSATNKELQQIDITNAVDFERYIRLYLTKKNKKVAYGGYNELRAIYKRSGHFYTENPKDERNIHLGVDFWCAAGTAVLAVLNGVVHSFKNNTAFGDYGPTILLEHELKGVTFYSLYGHLSIQSLQGLTVGKTVKRGEVIGRLGNASVNGNYAPHLHFQIIKDVEGNFGDYKGVTSLNDKEKDLINCPDPNLLLKLK